jgi:hypothetical protein
MKRYNWKIGVLEDSKKKLLEAPEKLPNTSIPQELLEAINQLKGRRVSVTGHFDHKAEILVGQRSAPAGLFGASAQGLAVNPQVPHSISMEFRSSCRLCPSKPRCY